MSDATPSYQAKVAAWQQTRAGQEAARSHPKAATPRAKVIDLTDDSPPAATTSTHSSRNVASSPLYSGSSDSSSPVIVRMPGSSKPLPARPPLHDVPTNPSTSTRAPGSFNFAHANTLFLPNKQLPSFRKLDKQQARDDTRKGSAPPSAGNNNNKPHSVFAPFVSPSFTQPRDQSSSQGPSRPAQQQQTLPPPRHPYQPQPPTHPAQSHHISAKQAANSAVMQQYRSLGVPIAVPKNLPVHPPSYYSRLPVAAAPREKDDDEGFDLPEDNGPYSHMSAEDGEKALRELLESGMDVTGIDASDIAPEGLKCKLLKHQIQGVHWLKTREEGKKRGGILADDMGLGKTIQMIALMLSRRAKSKPKGTLIVAPVSLMSQWAAEIDDKTEFEQLSVLIYHGDQRKNCTAKKLMKYDVVITSYNTLASEWGRGQEKKPPKKSKKKAGGARADSDSDSDDVARRTSRPERTEPGPLLQAEFHRVVLDEAHNIKNPKAKMSQACCDVMAKYRWCLTGTPIQNNVHDLFSLFLFLGPIVKPMHKKDQFDAKIAQPLKAGRGAIALKRLRVILGAIMLRRTKETRIEGKPLIVLPERVINVVTVPFESEDERAFYDAVERKVQLTMNKFLKSGTAMKNYIDVLTLLLRMRQACNHPHLITGSSAADDREGRDIAPAPKGAVEREAPEVDDLAAGLSGLSVSAPRCAICAAPGVVPQTAFCQTCTDEVASMERLDKSTKVSETVRLLRVIRREEGNKKTIIFSQFTKMLDLLQPFISAMGIKAARYDGSMSVKEREESLSRIRSDPQTTVILISLKAGSTGLNLTCCSRVILLDLWWNPAIEWQAFDRVHRFGQRENVNVYKITIEHTIEDRVLKLQNDKAELAKAALSEDGGSLKNQKLTLRDMMFLFKGDGADESSSKK